MSAKIILFPPCTTAAAASHQASPRPARSPDRRPPLARKFEDHYLPIVQASLELIDADERDFEARCRQMLDVEGGAMIDELCGELQTVRTQMQLLVDGLEVARARLRTAMSRLAPARSLAPEI